MDKYDHDLFCSHTDTVSPSLPENSNFFMQQLDAVHERRLVERIYRHASGPSGSQIGSSYSTGIGPFYRIWLHSADCHVDFNRFGSNDIATSIRMTELLLDSQNSHASLHGLLNLAIEAHLKHVGKLLMYEQS
jgi:hypothetical protein